MKIARDHLAGEEQLIHIGNLSAIQSNGGGYREGLEEQRDLQRLFEQAPEGPDRARNILASKTQQINLLIHLGHADDALLGLPSILDETKNWTRAAPASAEAHVLGLFGEAYRAKKEYGKAAGYFAQALSSLEKRGAKEERAIFLYSLATALLQNDDVNGAFTVLAILEKELSERPRPELLSNFYHLKGRLLSESHNPEAMKYLLQSLELDLEFGNGEDALVSLVTVVHNAHLSDDRDAIRSMLPMVRSFASTSQHPEHLKTVAELESIVAGWDD
jgi:tetratricopeptide (TPR) repeat protein